MNLLPIRLIYEGTEIGACTTPIPPMPESLIQFNNTIFVVYGYILNLDDKVLDVHVRLIEDVQPTTNPTNSQISLN